VASTQVNKLFARVHRKKATEPNSKLAFAFSLKASHFHHQITPHIQADALLHIDIASNVVRIVLPEAIREPDNHLDMALRVPVEPEQRNCCRELF